MLKFFCLFIGLIFLQSCTGTYEENEKRAKELYGECDRPGKNLRSNKSKYKECKARERAGGKSLFDLDGDLNDLIGKGNNQVVYQYSVNTFLWNASLEVTQSYPLKIADNQGGFLETGWISEPGNDLQRCLIKIRITSQELVSNGVSTNLICETFQNNNWVTDNKSYDEEQKQLTLKILSIASKLSNNAS
jgi:hypothetical protein